MTQLQNIKQEFPKSYERLKTWSGRLLATFQGMLLKEAGDNGSLLTAPEISELIIEHYANHIFLNHRQLYDFFSEQHMEICVDYMDMDKEKNRKQFMYKIYYDHSPVIMSFYDRSVTEFEAFHRAFTILEESI